MGEKRPTFTIQCSSPEQREEIRKAIHEVKSRWKGGAVPTTPHVLIAALGTLLGLMKPQPKP